VGDPVSPPLVCVGLSHHTAPVEVRERLALPEDRQTELLQVTARAPAEALLISTCNRVELYVVGPGDDLHDRTRAALARAAGDDLLPYLYAHRGESAVLHLFRVAASLDSMVLGEPQILGQVKDAFEQAQRLGAARGELARLCAAAFGSAKRVRTETELGRAATSMASAAVEMARHIFDGLEGKTVLLIGAGEMAELSGKHLLSAGASRVLVTNRTLDRAESLAASLGGQPVPFERLEESLVLADVVVCTTASPAPVITREKVARVLKPRRHRPLFLVDLAVPRDVEPGVHALDGVYAYDVDDIQKVVDQNQAARTAAAATAEVLVAEEVARYVRQRAVRDQVPVLAQLRARAEQIRRAELERAMANLSAPLSPEQAKVIEAMTSAIVNKMLHQPTARLRAVQAGDSELADAAAELFGLDATPRKAGEG
jgi:glutamyl-tRNA reductase